MKPSLRPGVTRVNRIAIGRERTIGFMGEEARTYGTPSMILDIEHTCRELIIEHADPGRGFGRDGGRGQASRARRSWA